MPHVIKKNPWVPIWDPSNFLYECVMVFMVWWFCRAYNMSHTCCHRLYLIDVVAYFLWIKPTSKVFLSIHQIWRSFSESKNGNVIILITFGTFREKNSFYTYILYLWSGGWDQNEKNALCIHRFLFFVFFKCSHY